MVDLPQTLVGKSQRLDAAQPGGLHEEVGRGQKLGEDLALGRVVLEIEDNAPLVGIGVNKGEAALGMLDVSGERRKEPRRIASRRLDFDNVRAQIGEKTCRIGSGDVS